MNCLVVLCEAENMVSVKINDKEQRENAPVVNGSLKHGKRKAFYRPGKTARAEIRRLWFLEESVNVNRRRDIQLARRIRGKQACQIAWT